MPKTVLIVDDSATMRKTIMRGIRKAGIAHTEFREAGDGVAGLKAAAARTFDLILSDVDMPGMDGLEFVRAVKAQTPTPPPIVVMTTEGGEDVVQAALDHGAHGCLRKPFTPDRIQEVLGPLLK